MAVGNIFRGQFHRHLSDLRRAVYLATKVEFIVRRHVLTDAFSDTMESDRGDMMLRARIVAAADLDGGPRQILRDLAGRKYFSHRASQVLWTR